MNTPKYGKNPPLGAEQNIKEDHMDDFTQFQLKEYENISQAHFKTNEVLARSIATSY